MLANESVMTQMVINAVFSKEGGKTFNERIKSLMGN